MVGFDAQTIFCKIASHERRGFSPKITVLPPDGMRCIGDLFRQTEFSAAESGRNLKRLPAPMKTSPARLLLPCALVGAVWCFVPCPALAQYFTEDFESYAVGGSLAPNWTPYYNGASVVGSATVSGSSGNILQISSASSWAGYAFRAVSFAQEFRFEADIYSTSSNGPIIDLWHGPGDNSPYYRMLTLLNGNFYQGDATKQQIGTTTWNGLSWHHLTIDYARADAAQSATVTYYFDEQLLGQVTTPGTTPWDTSTHYLALANNFSGTTYFDNVSISAAVPEPAAGAALAGVAVALAALWRRRRRM